MSSKHNVLEVELDFASEQLLASHEAAAELEIDDVVAIATASADTNPPPEPPREYGLDETSEIELTAEQMDALLEGRWQP